MAGKQPIGGAEFEKLAKALAQVPKAELDQQAKRDKAAKKRRRNRKKK